MLVELAFYAGYGYLITIMNFPYDVFGKGELQTKKEKLFEFVISLHIFVLFFYFAYCIVLFSFLLIVFLHCVCLCCFCVCAFGFISYV